LGISHSARFVARYCFTRFIIWLDALESAFFNKEAQNVAFDGSAIIRMGIIEPKTEKDSVRRNIGDLKSRNSFDPRLFQFINIDN